jgi:HEAT repeat protein
LPESTDQPDPDLPVYASDFIEPELELARKRKKQALLVFGLVGLFVMAGSMIVILLVKSKEGEKQAIASANKSPSVPTPVKEPRSGRFAEKAPAADPPEPKPDEPELDVPAFPRQQPKEEEFDPNPPPKRPKMDHDAAVAQKRPPPQPADDDKQIKALILVLTKDLRGRKASDRIKGAEGLKELGLKAKAASRDLCKALLDPILKVGQAAANALDKVNPTLYELVIPLIRDNKIGNKIQAVEKIGQLGAEGNAAVPVLLSFKAAHLGGERQAVYALAAVAPEEKLIAVAMAEWLVKDENSGVRQAAAESLPKMKHASEAIPNLIVTLKNDKVDKVREAAAKALGQIGDDAEEVIKALEAAKLDPSAEVRKAASEAINRMHKPNIDPDVRTSLKVKPPKAFRRGAATGPHGTRRHPRDRDTIDSSHSSRGDRPLAYSNHRRISSKTTMPPSTGKGRTSVLFMNVLNCHSA